MTPLDQDPAVATDDDLTPRRRWPFALTIAAVLTLLGGWIYTLFIYDPGLLIDQLEDRTFPRAAEEICAEARGDLDQLPQAYDVHSAAERADAVAASNVILSSMVDRMEAVAPTEPAKVRDGVREWLGDWRTYIADREQYAESLRVDPEARFLESPKASATKGITRAIDPFAQVNEMSSCTTLADVS